jgi:heat shock protein HslJ
MRFGLVAVGAVALMTACSGSGSGSGSGPGSSAASPPVATSGGSVPGGTTPARVTDGLEGTAWDLVSYRGPAAASVPVVPGASANLAFGPRGQLAGSGGCNSFAGTWSATGDRLTLTVGATTRKACAPALMLQETAVLQLLTKVATFALDDPTLNLRDDSGGVVLSYNAGVNDLPGTAWKVTGVNNGKGAVESSAATEALTMAFAADGTFSGFGGCNQLSGPFETSGRDGLKIGPLTATTKTCGDEADRLEQQFSTALANAATFEVRGDALTLRDAAGAIQVSATITR